MTSSLQGRLLSVGPRAARRRTVIEGLLSGFVLQALLLVNGVLAARILGPTDRGLLALIWVVSLIATQLGSVGMPLAVTYELAQGGIALTTLARLLKRVVLVQTLALLVVVALGLTVLTMTRGLPTGPALVALLVVPAMVVHSYSLAAIQGCSKFLALHVYRLMPTAIYALILIAGAMAGGDTLLFVTAGWVVGYVAAAALSFLQARRLAGSGPDAHDERATTPGAMIRFGAAGLLGYVSPTDVFRFDQLVVGLALPPRDLGLYVTALSFCNLPRFLAQGLGLVLYPAIAAAPDDATKRRLLWRYTGAGAAAATVVVVPLIVFARPTITLAFGADFAGAVATAQILLAGTVVVCIRRLIADGLRGAGAPGPGSVAEALSWLWLAPALAILIPLMGLPGVALAVTSSYLVTTVLLFRAATKMHLGIRHRA